MCNEEDPKVASVLMKFCFVLMVAAIALAAVLTTGCGEHSVKPGKPPPVAAQCDSMCYLPCVKEDGDTGVSWTGDPQDPAMFDILAEEVTLPLAEKLRVCEVRRKACTQCLDRLKTEGVIL